MTTFRRTATLLALALPLLLAACGGTNEPSPDAGPGRLMFTRAGNGFDDIYTVDVSHGQNLQQVSTSFALDEWASWSPDTFKIVFQSDLSLDTLTAHFQIYVMNSDGSNISQLTFADTARDSTGALKDTSSNYQPAWSPNGAQIAFASSRDTNSEIYVMDANGANVVRLTDTTASVRGGPGWSAGGTGIAFGEGGRILGIDARGSHQVPLTRGFWAGRFPRWRPIL